MRTIPEILLYLEVIYMDTSIDWERKYDLIFSLEVSRRLLDFCQENRIDLSYYDPDTTYEEDTRAFCEAILNVKREIYRACQGSEKDDPTELGPGGSFHCKKCGKTEEVSLPLGLRLHQKNMVRFVQEHSNC